MSICDDLTFFWGAGSKNESISLHPIFTPISIKNRLFFLSI